MVVAPKPRDTLCRAPRAITPVRKYGVAKSHRMAQMLSINLDNLIKLLPVCSCRVRCLDGAERRQRSIRHPWLHITGVGLRQTFFGNRLGAAWTPTASSRWQSTATSVAGRDVGYTAIGWCARLSAQSIRKNLMFTTKQRHCGKQSVKRRSRRSS